MMDADDLPDWASLDVDQLGMASEYDQLPVVDMGELPDEAPPREWIVPGWLGARSVVLFAGMGGTGKSLFIQQLLTAIGTSAEFAGLRGTLTPTLYINCEDEPEELHRRSNDICRALKVDRTWLRGSVFTLSRAGMPGNELGTFDAARVFEPGPLLRQIEQTALRIGARVIALDNVAHLYTGSENTRAEVTQFVNALLRIAIAIDGAVVLVGHPAKTEGSEYSGSTGWENAVRTRWFLERPEGDEGELSNDRILSRGKANYAAKGAKVEVTWKDGAFVPHDNSVTFGEPEMAARDNAIFLECLALATKQNRAVSHSPNAGSYAPKVFVKMAEARRLKIPALASAMERLFALGKIEADQQLWRRPNSSWVHGIAAVTNPHRSVSTPVHTGSAQPIEIVPTPVPPPPCLLLRNKGGAFGGPALPENEPDELLDWAPR